MYYDKRSRMIGVIRLLTMAIEVGKSPMAFKTIPVGRICGDKRIAVRFMKFVNQAENGCWLWTGATQLNIDGTRRAQFRCYGSRSASRVSYALFNGDVPPKKLVLHSCDNPLCVCPEHLRLGTHKENATDMVRRGRSTKGTTATGRGLGVKRKFGGRVNKLTDNDVRCIRDDLANGMLLKDVAARYKVSVVHVSLIRSGKRKAHIK